MKSCLYNLIASLRNAQSVNKAFILHKRKKNCEALLNVLWDEGFILGYKIFPQNHILKVYLKYVRNLPVINNIKVVSKPGFRIYYSYKNLIKFNTLNGMLILSTNQGIKTSEECKNLRLGGEPLIIIK